MTNIYDLPSEMIGEIIHWIPITFYPTITRISMIFCKEVLKTIKPIKNRDDYIKACLNGDYLSLNSVFASIDISPEASLGLGLEYACQGGHLLLVKFLSKNFLYLTNLKNAVDQACKHNHFHIIKYLIDTFHFHSAFILHGGLKNALVACIEQFPISGSLDIIEYLIDKYGEVIDLNACLYHACKLGIMELIDFFIKEGATDYDKGFYGACKGGREEVVKKLLSLITSDRYVFTTGFIMACHNHENNYKKIFQILNNESKNYNNTVCSCGKTMKEHLNSD